MFDGLVMDSCIFMIIYVISYNSEGESGAKEDDRKVVENRRRIWKRSHAYSWRMAPSNWIIDPSAKFEKELN